MSSKLPINDSIVPAHVTEGYLKVYSEAERKTIAEVYDVISKEAFSNPNLIKYTKPSVLLVIGAQGSGKSTLAKTLTKKEATFDIQYVNADVDRILKSIPDVEHDLISIAQDAQIVSERGGYDLAKHFNDADAAIKKWRPAAEYMRDRLMMDALGNGYNVLMQASGKSSGVAKLIEALGKTAHSVETHICVSPISVAIKGAHSPQHGLSYPDETIRADHEAMRKNIPAIMLAGQKRVTLYYRGEETGSAEMVLHVADGRITLQHVRPYDAHVADLGCGIGTKDLRLTLSKNQAPALAQRYALA